MARYRAESVPALKSWREVDEALRQMALEEIQLADIQGDMEKQIIGMKKVAEVQSKPHTDRLAQLTRDVENFVTEHREELGKTRTKLLTFGTCGFRRSTTLSILKVAEKLDALIKKLYALGLKDCVVMKETVDKNALKKQGREVATEVGAKWVEKDTFWCEPAREKLEQLQAGQLPRG